MPRSSNSLHAARRIPAFYEDLVLETIPLAAKKTGLMVNGSWSHRQERAPVREGDRLRVVDGKKAVHVRGIQKVDVFQVEPDWRSDRPGVARLPGVQDIKSMWQQRDERSSAIEIQLNEPLPLTDALIAVVLPKPYMEDTEIKDALQRWRVRPCAPHR